MSKAYGKKVWLIPDGFLHSVSLNDQVSHEAVCVLNTSDKDAVISLTLYFEDREPMTGRVTSIFAEWIPLLFENRM